MSVLIVAWSAHWFQLAIANLIIKPYEIGLLSLSSTDSNELIIDWNLTGSKSMNLDLGPTTIPFLIAGFLKLNYIVIVFTGILIFSIERCLACLLLDDYEKKSRNHISIGLLISCYAITYSITVIWFFNPLDFYWAMLILLSPSTMAVLLLYTSRRYNLQISRLLENSTSRYTLPAKYQAMENIRCFQMISKVISAVITLVFLYVLLFMAIHWNWCPRGMELLINAVLETFLQWNPLIINTILMHSVPQWRKSSIFWKLLEKSNNRRRNMVQPREGEGEEEDGRRNEAEEYFEQLRNAWS